MDLWMQRALQLARYGKGKVSPNPLVGSVMVHQDRIIGEGWHGQFGGPHAEVEAISSVEDKALLTKSTMYVTLEPCNHHGKTPPCIDLILKHKIPHVVICNTDPNPKVKDQGIQKLKSNGVQVETGLLGEQGAWLNRRFFTFHKLKRPYIILKWAQTTDGFIARENGDSKWISSMRSRMHVHRYRSEEDAILIGSGTAMTDNPKLTTRQWPGKNPTRIIIDRFEKLDNSLNIFDNQAPTLFYSYTTMKEPRPAYIRIPKENFFHQLLQDLYDRNIQSVLVEGGAAVLNQFITYNLWDEAHIFTSPKTFGQGIPAPFINGTKIHQEAIDEDALHVIQNKS